MEDALIRELGALRQDFQRHEDRDETRFTDVREDVKANSADIVDLKTAQANMTGRLTVIGGLAIIGIPVLSEIVRAFSESHIVGH